MSEDNIVTKTGRRTLRAVKRDVDGAVVWMNSPGFGAVVTTTSPTGATLTFTKKILTRPARFIKGSVKATVETGTSNTFTVRLKAFTESGTPTVVSTTTSFSTTQTGWTVNVPTFTFDRPTLRLGTLKLTLLRTCDAIRKATFNLQVNDETPLIG